MRYPEAGGSSSFARHAFNELVSFGAAWAQMLVYVVTITTSAFFVPALPLDLLGAAAREPVGRRRRDRRRRRARRAEHRRRQGGGGAQRLPRRRRLRHPAPARPARLRARLQPGDRCRQRPLGRRADVGQPRARDPGRRCSPTPGVETVSNLAEEVRDPVRSVPERLPARRRRRLRDLLHAAVRRALGAARSSSSTASTRRCSGSRRRRAATRTTRCSGVVAEPRPLGLRYSTRRRSTSACSPRRSCSSPRTPA